MIWNLSLTSKGFRPVLDFGSWSRTVARVWPNCCQLTIWLFNQWGNRCDRVVQTSLPVKKSCCPQDQSFDDELNHPNLMVNGLILTNGQKIAQI